MTDVRFVGFPDKPSQSQKEGKKDAEGDEWIDGNSIYRTKNIFIHNDLDLLGFDIGS